MSIDPGKLLDDYSKMHEHRGTKQKDYVMVSAEFKRWDDYIFDENTQIHVLKPDAKPYAWRILNKEFKTLDELVIFMQLNYIDDECFVLDMRDKEANMFIDAWREANA